MISNEVNGKVRNSGFLPSNQSQEACSFLIKETVIAGPPDLSLTTDPTTIVAFSIIGGCFVG